VTGYVAVSRDLENYLAAKVGISRQRIVQIYNGVDTQRFTPRKEQHAPIQGCPFVGPEFWLVGTVGRMAIVKDQLTLARAFIRALELDPAQRTRMRLILIGDGPLRSHAQALLERAGVGELAWLPGNRSEVSVILRRLDCFVLPSLGEGISNTILEAMASGLPVVATDVGGNGELIEQGGTGELIPSADPEALAHTMLAYACNPERARATGKAGRARVEQLFTLDAMIASYKKVYDQHLHYASTRMERVGAV
jgi:sugar transferase (PEP-CTERM/EpsH1 system associated)